MRAGCDNPPRFQPALELPQAPVEGYAAANFLRPKRYGETSVAVRTNSGWQQARPREFGSSGLNRGCSQPQCNVKQAVVCCVGIGGWPGSVGEVGLMSRPAM